MAGNVEIRAESANSTLDRVVSNRPKGVGELKEH